MKNMTISLIFRNILMTKTSNIQELSLKEQIQKSQNDLKDAIYF